jgi:hypothetical protein
VKSTLLPTGLVALMVLLPVAALAETAPPNSAAASPETATPEPAPTAPAAAPETPAAPETSATLTPPAAPPPPYSLPWGLRPAIAPKLVRLEGSFALRDHGAFTTPLVLTGGYRVMPDLAVLVKDAVIYDDPASSAKSGAAIVNPLLAILYTPKLGSFRVPVFVGATIPIGSGGGESTAPPSASYVAAGSGVYARSGLDNAIMAVNYAAVTAGAAVAYVDRGLTVQAEATLIELMRARGGRPLEPDGARTNFTSGLHVGYSLLDDYLVPSAELRAQLWLTTPAAVRADTSKREQLTFGGGVRTKIPISGSTVARPGMSYFRPVDDPMSKAGYQIFTVDVPVVF